MLTINKLLMLNGLNTTKNIKIARHQDTRDIDVHNLYHTNHFELYQSYQEKNQFKDCDYLVSCLGIDNNQALFIGIYRVKATYKVNGFPENLSVPYRGKAKLDSKFRYDLEKMEGFEELENRVVIKWGGVAQAWCVWLDKNPKELVQILPKGYVRNFPGYLDFNLNYRELRDIIKNPDANQVWHKMLSSVGAVYLIVDTKNGLQYVGSASGKDGILGRFKDYGKNGHGNNKRLKEILEAEPDRVFGFKYTLLKTLPLTLTNKEVIDEENKYKEKLGSRAFGLNSN
ncbi:excinuclease ABC subunit C [Bacillus cereus]|uniref:GIY-YIG nuclease family protein n=1 Tax=Bacillus cereus TaxID=1396 RepID=UPI000BF7F355|nr:GIY-YIG nuclease family protein [Bacillus cereus]PEQ99447.1 excinuclease ABC subunit C [Bacillus cereus]PEX04828.1 excinuclease ABC subunit C [Bacillus cereus]PEY42021.1 excinuclease ABC subunit C [Bacillus cereus]